MSDDEKQRMRERLSALDAAYKAERALRPPTEKLSP